jgi:GT2 family glycosyltransferase
MSSKQTLYVGIVTAGRREQVRLTLAQLGRQTTMPDKIIVCPASPDDFDPACAASTRAPLEQVSAPRGICAQRNAVLDASRDADIIVFFDDDYYPAPDYLAHVIELFDEAPDVVMATSWPELDGAVGPGVAHDEALRHIEAYAARPASRSIGPARNGYGCNMAIRLAKVHELGLRFDERLPLYGWLEDVDFSGRLAPYGRIVTSSGLRGVHLGTKLGRGSGLRFGYSQIANPLYMVQKGSLSTRGAARQILRNVGSNVVRALRPEPWVDRRGRLRGNVMAARDLLTGTLAPENILRL